MDLSRIQLVAGLRPAEAQEIVALGSPLRLSSGAALFGLGEPAERLFIVERGRIALMAPLELNRHQQDVLVEERVAGEVVGWSALIPPYRYTLDAVASIETDLIAIARTALLGYVAAQSRVSCILMENVAKVVGQRLQVFQAMWLREMQQAIELRGQAAGRLP